MNLRKKITKSLMCTTMSLCISAQLMGCTSAEPAPPLPSDNNTITETETSAPEKIDKTEETYTTDTSVGSAEADNTDLDLTEKESSTADQLPEEEWLYGSEVDLESPPAYDYSAEPRDASPIGSLHQFPGLTYYYDGEYFCCKWNPFEGAAGYDVLYSIGTYLGPESGYDKSKRHAVGISTIKECRFRVFAPADEYISIAIRPRNSLSSIITTEDMHNSDDWHVDDEWWFVIGEPCITSSSIKSIYDYRALACLDAREVEFWGSSNGYAVDKISLPTGTMIEITVPDPKNTAFERVSQALLDTVPEKAWDYIIGRDKESDSLDDALSDATFNSIADGLNDYFTNDYNIHCIYYFPNGREYYSAKTSYIIRPCENRENYSEIVSDYGTDYEYRTDSDYFSGLVDDWTGYLYKDFLDYNIHRRIYLDYRNWKDKNVWVDIVRTEPQNPYN